MKTGWTLKKIKDGFEKFRKEHGLLPTAYEIDHTSYLPSSRYIQKRFGGLECLRTEFGYSDTHFGKGTSRSIIAQSVGTAGRLLEAEFGQELTQLFSPDCIEIEKSFDGRRRVDFYIITEEESFGIDIFNAQTMQTLQSSVNIKLRKYNSFSDLLFLTVASEHITQKELDVYTANRKTPLPGHISLITLKRFRRKLKKISKSRRL